MKWNMYRLDATLAMGATLLSSIVVLGLVRIFLRRLRPPPLDAARPAFTARDWWRPTLPLTAIMIADNFMCVKQVNWSSLGISKRVRFRVKNEDRKIVTYFTELNDLFDCEVLPLSKSLNLRFVAVWLRRWRELILYLRIATDLGRGRDFVYRNYLPLTRAARGALH